MSIQYHILFSRKGIQYYILSRKDHSQEHSVYENVFVKYKENSKFLAILLQSIPIVLFSTAYETKQFQTAQAVFSYRPCEQKRKILQNTCDQMFSLSFKKFV